MRNDIVCLHRTWRIVASLLILFCLTVIFLFSGQDGQTSDSLSTRVTAAIIRLATSETPDAQSLAFTRVHHAVRKLAHATEYGLLAASCALLLHTFPIGTWKRFLYAGLACLPTASLDEYLQTFRAGRCGSPVDVGVDMLGACAALLLFYLIWRRIVNGRGGRMR